MSRMLPAAFIAAALAHVACGASPSSPSTTPATGAVTSLAAPAISGVTPSALVAGSAAQTVTVTGTNFRAGLSVTFGIKGGTPTTIPGSQVSNLTATSFQIAVTVAKTGAYEFLVTNPDGQASAAFDVLARSPSPTIASVSPSSLKASPAVQVITLTGANFSDGLSLALTFSDGTSTTVSGSSITSVTPTSVQASVILSSAGNDSIRVSTADGVASDPFVFMVQPPDPPAQSNITVLSTSPAAGGTVITGASANGQPPSFLSSLPAVTVSVRSSTAIAAARIEIDVLDAAGNRCGYGFVDAFDLPANTPTTRTASDFGWACALPVTTTSTSVTVYTNPSNGVRINQFGEAFPIGFSFQAFADGSGQPTVVPSVATLAWHDAVPGCGGDCLQPDDGMFVYCGAFASDGQALTASLSLTWDGRATETTTVAFPAGASSQPTRNLSYGLWSVSVTGAAVIHNSTVRAGLNGGHPHAIATCTVTNARGDNVSRTIGIPR